MEHVKIVYKGPRTEHNSQIKSTPQFAQITKKTNTIKRQQPTPKTTHKNKHKTNTKNQSQEPHKQNHKPQAKNHKLNDGPKSQKKDKPKNRT